MKRKDIINLAGRLALVRPTNDKRAYYGWLWAVNAVADACHLLNSDFDRREFHDMCLK